MTRPAMDAGIHITSLGFGKRTLSVCDATCVAHTDLVVFEMSKNDILNTHVPSHVQHNSPAHDLQAR